MKYLQINEDNIITDCIDYECDGYVEYSREINQSVHGGWFELINGEIVERIDLNPNTIDNKIEEAIDSYTLELIEGGLL